MSKITFEYEGQPYTLEFDRDTVSNAEQVYGISLNAIREARISVFPMLFRAAFMKHHPRTSTKVIDAIYDCMPDKQQLFLELVSMYSDTVSSLLADPSKGKAISWATS